MKQKLCWLFPHLDQDGGGTKFLLEVTSRLTKDYDVTVVCNTGKEEIIRSFQNKGVSVITTSFLSANSNIYWLFLPVFLLFDFLKYRKYLRSADSILSTMYPSNFLAYLFRLTAKKQYYYYCYEPFPYLQNKKFFAEQPFVKRVMMATFAFLYAWTDTAAVRGAKKIFTLNEITQKMITRTYLRPSTITYMGVDTRHFLHYKKSFVTEKFKGKVLITHSTDYSQMKRTDLAIKAFTYLIKDHPSALLLITSTHPHSPNKRLYKAMVKKLHLTHNVRFLGYVSYEDVPKYYSASRCYLSCSYDDMLGTTTSNLPVKEALSCETPAIRAPVTNEDVIDDVSGFLVDPRKSIRVAKKLSYLIKNKAKAELMGKKGRNTIVSRYSWDRVAKILIDNLT